VAEERGEYRRGDSGELHHTSDSDGGQRVNVCSGGKQYDGDGDEQCRDPDGECGPGGADDHHTAGEPDRDGRADS